MSRIASAANAIEAGKPSVIMCVLGEFDFATGMVRAHDGIGTLEWNGNEYLGVGKFGGVDSVSEDLTNIARPVRVTLSGVDASLVQETMQEVYQDRSAALYLGFLDVETNVFVAAPEVIWEGRMDTMTLKVSQGQAVIELNCEHRLRREPRIARYTDEDQKLAYPTDRFFDLLHTIKGYRARWGDERVTWNYVAPVFARLFPNR